jgi:hypothetical protein
MVVTPQDFFGRLLAGNAFTKHIGGRTVCLITAVLFPPAILLDLIAGLVGLPVALCNSRVTAQMCANQFRIHLSIAGLGVMLLTRVSRNGV